MDTFTRRSNTLFACLVLFAAAAAAQTNPAQQGPLVILPSDDGPVLAPEVKIAGFEDGGDIGTFVGGYGGWLFDNRLLLGGAVSFLVDHEYNDRVAGMNYGGFLAGWTVPVGRVLNLGVRGLVGFGAADLTDSYPWMLPERDRAVAATDPRRGRGAWMHPPATPPGGGTSLVLPFRFWDDFFIFEPQGTAVIRLARGVALDVSGVYRVISGLGRYNGWLRGASGSVAVRIGPRL